MYSPFDSWWRLNFGFWTPMFWIERTGGVGCTTLAFANGQDWRSSLINLGSWIQDSRFPVQFVAILNPNLDSCIQYSANLESQSQDWTFGFKIVPNHSSKSCWTHGTESGKTLSATSQLRFNLPQLQPNIGTCYLRLPRYLKIWKTTEIQHIHMQWFLHPNATPCNDPFQSDLIGFYLQVAVSRMNSAWKTHEAPILNRREPSMFFNVHTLLLQCKPSRGTCSPSCVFLGCSFGKLVAVTWNRLEQNQAKH